MAYRRPNGKMNNAPIGSRLEEGLHNYADRPKYEGNYSGGDPFKALDDEARKAGNWDSTRSFERGLGDFVGDISNMFFPGGYSVQSPYQMDQNAFGLPNAGAWQAMLANNGADARGRNVLDMRGADQMRGVQTDLIQNLQKQARGEGPSLAQMQLQKATDQNIAQTMGMAASGRGPGQSAQMKSAMNQSAQQRQQAAGVPDDVGVGDGEFHGYCSFSWIARFGIEGCQALKTRQ